MGDYLKPHKYPPRILLFFVFIISIFILTIVKLARLKEIKRDNLISKNLIKNADSLLALNQLTPAIKIYEKAYYLNKSVPLSKLIVPLLLQQKEKSTLKAIAYLTDFESLTVKEFAIVKQSIDDKYKNYFYYTILLKDTTIQFNQIKFERNEPELWKKVLKFKNQHKSTKHKHLS